MRTKLKILTPVIVIIVVMFINFNITNEKEDFVSLTINNIEALASEYPYPGSEWISCSETISSYGTGNLTHVTYCGECAPKLARAWRNTYRCYK